jgi:GTP-binding protein
MLSAVSGEGVKEALFALAREIAKKDAEEEAQNPEANEPWQP